VPKSTTESLADDPTNPKASPKVVIISLVVTQILAWGVVLPPGGACEPDRR
jgi:hypothetical protein